METDAELSDVLNKIISGDVTREEFTEAFRLIYHLCEVEDSSENVYRIVRSSLRDNVRKKFEKIQECPDDETFLRIYRDEWRGYCELVTVLQSLLHSMDRQILSENLLVHEDWRTLESMAFGNWDEIVLHQVDQRLIGALLRASDLDRNAKPIFSDAELATVIEAIMQRSGSADQNQTYTRYRKAYFLHLEELYWMNSSTNQTAHETIRISRNFIVEELLRARKYLRQDDESIATSMHKFIFANDAGFVTKMVTTAIAESDLTILKELYGCLRPMNESGVKLLSRVMTACVPDHVRQLHATNSERERDAATMFVGVISTVEENFRRIMREAFDNDPLLDILCSALCERAIRELEALLGRPSGQLVAVFYDKILGSVREDNVEDTNKGLDRASTAAKYLMSAEDFQATYVGLLHERFAKNRWSNVDVEKRAVHALQKIKGEKFTAPMTRMLSDIIGSKVINQIFGDFLRKSGTYAGDFEVIVVSAEFWHWEAPKSPLVRLPRNIEDNLRFYETLYPEYIQRLSYGNENSGNQGTIGRWKPSKKLTWFHDRAEVEIEVNLPSEGRSYLLICNALTAIVLLLFEEDGLQSISNIRQKTKLSDSDLRTVLNQLRETELLETMVGSDGCETPQYVFNLNFKSETRVVNLLESTKSMGSVAQDRETTRASNPAIYTEALLIRILKKHRELTLDELVKLFRAEAPSCRLNQDDSLISKVLASLAAKFYVRVDGFVYHYIP